MVARGLVMKGDGQLNYALEMPAQGLVVRPISIQGAPNVFENFVSVEKMGAVEKIQPSFEVCAVVRHSHNGLAPTDCVTPTQIYTFS